MECESIEVPTVRFSDAESEDLPLLSSSTSWHEPLLTMPRGDEVPTVPSGFVSEGTTFHNHSQHDNTSGSAHLRQGESSSSGATLSEQFPSTLPLDVSALFEEYEEVHNCKLIILTLVFRAGTHVQGHA